VPNGQFQELGRHVKRGEKAIELCMPVTCKRTVADQGSDGNEGETEITFKRFVFRRNWFMLSQTDGAEYQRPPIPAWDRGRALATRGGTGESGDRRRWSNRATRPHLATIGSRSTIQQQIDLEGL
jgi:hypothetical protein